MSDHEEPRSIIPFLWMVINAASLIVSVLFALWGLPDFQGVDPLILMRVAILRLVFAHIVIMTSAWALMKLWLIAAGKESD